jgi:GNAT superfamily N-acetyltransferase
MHFLRRFFSSAPPKFTTSLEWIVIPPDNFCLSAQVGETKIGQATGDYQDGEVLRIVKLDVYAGYRNKGYGSKLIEQLIAEAKQKKCSYIVFAGVSVDNKPATNLYLNRFSALPRAIPNCTDKQDYVLHLP